MANRIQGDDDDAIVDINITPFVDVVLVLLVIFMVTAHFIVNSGVNIELPKAQSAEKLKEQKDFNISVQSDGSYHFNGKGIDVSELKKMVHEKVVSGQNTSVTISADKNVIYSQVVQLMDVLRLEGVVNFALQLEPVNP